MDDIHIRLKTIYEKRFGPFTLPGKMANLDILAKHLSELVGRETPWTARFINSLICQHKNVFYGDELVRAVTLIEGQDFPQQKAHLYQHPDAVIEPGSIVLGDSVRCPVCKVSFVPKVWNGRYDKDRCRKIARNERRKKQRENLHSAYQS